MKLKKDILTLRHHIYTYILLAAIYILNHINQIIIKICIILQDATIKSLVAIEVLMWFYVGECIGKRHLIGYDIKL